MAKIVEEYKLYEIPENFAQEGYVMQGRVRIRGLIDLCIVMIPFLAVWLMLDWGYEAKIVVLGSLALPFGIVALAGINGDSLTDYLRNAYRWQKNKKHALHKYDPNPQPFYRSATDVLMGDKIPMDELVEKFRKMQKDKLEKKLAREYIEGENFVFMEDASIRRYTAVPDESEVVPALSISSQDEDLFTLLEREQEKGEGKDNE